MSNHESTKCFVPAPYDRIVKTVTVFLLIFLPIVDGIILFFIFSSMNISSGMAFTIGVLVIGLTMTILLVTYLFSPKSYALTSNSLVIQRRIKTVSIPFAKILDVKQIDWTWKIARLGGSGGLYGYLGLFHISGIGRVWMYVTNKDRIVFLKTKEGKQYAISPKNTEGFISTLNQQLKYPED